MCYNFIRVRNDASALQCLSSLPSPCHIWIWLPSSSAPLSAVGERDRYRVEGKRPKKRRLARSVSPRPQPSRIKKRGKEGHLTYSHTLTLSVSPISSYFPPPSPTLSCLEYDELQPAGKPGAGDSVPKGAHHYRPEPTESHTDAALPDRGARPASGRAYRREQAPAGHQGTATSPLPSSPSPSPRPRQSSSSPPPSGSPVQNRSGVSLRTCDCTSTVRGGTGSAVANPNYEPGRHAAGTSRPVHGFPGRK